MRFAGPATGARPVELREIGVPDRKATGRQCELGDVLRDFVCHQDPEKFKRDLKALALTLPVVKQLEAARRWLDKPVAGGREAPAPEPAARQRDRTAKKKTRYQTPSGRPSVQRAHSLPRQGRSSWFEGLLRGPWG
jgi:hypothetical protein